MRGKNELKLEFLTVTTLLIALPAIAADAVTTDSDATDSRIINNVSVSPENTNLRINEIPEGYRLGEFIVQPELSLSQLYDSNIFADRADEIGDNILIFSPRLNLTSTWEQHKLGINLGGALGRYSSHEDENYDDYWINADGRYDLNDSSNLFGGLGFSREHEDRGPQEDSTFGDEPGTFQSSRFHAGVSHNWDKTTLRLGGTYEQLDFNNAGLVNNQDRDRELVGAGARLSYNIRPQYTLYGQLASDHRNYDKNADDLGFQRDSNGYLAGVGLKAIFTNRLKGEAYLGYIKQRYDDQRFSDVSELDIGGNLNWRATPLTTVSFGLDRSLEETTLADSSGYLYTSVNGLLRHKLTPRLDVYAGISVAEADYQGIDRIDEYYSSRFGMRYHLSPRWYLDGEYSVQVRNSDTQEDINNPASPQGLNDYGRNQFLLTLGTLLYPVKRSTYWDALSGEALSFTGAEWSGLYLGAQLGHDTLNLQTQGGRDQGIDISDYSDSSSSSGLFAGYGKSRGPWYAGVEIEYEDSNVDIYHRKSKLSSRTLDLSKGDSYGIGLRAGYQLNTGPLIYARLGAVSTDFDVYMTVNDRTDSAYDDAPEKTGTRLGIGTDIPISDRLFARLDYTHTDYGDFSGSVLDSNDDLQVERFSPREDLFRIGLGWQLDEPSPVNHSKEIDYNSFYAGAGVGHGALQSDTTGIHTDSTSADPGPFSFVSDFGNDSATTAGVFLGYGHTFGPYYLSLETELEDSDTEWSHERSPTGRDFSVEKRDTWGISLRAGYVLQNDSLLYIRTGRVRTRFNTTWDKGDSSVNNTDRDDRLSGTRFGLGAELPISRNIFARLDYTFTDYDSYGFVSSHGSQDTMKFDNSETLFRIGIGARF